MKKIISIISVVAIVCSMSACSLFDNTERKLRDTTDEFMTKAKEFDLDAMNEMSSSDDAFSIEKLEGEESEELESQEEAETDVLEDALMSYMKYCAAKIKYEIKSIDKENLKVSVSYEYIDSTNFMTNFMEAYIKALFNGDIDVDASEDEQKEQMEKISDQVLKDTEDEFIKKDVVLEYEKKDDTYLLKDNEDFGIVFSANMEEASQTAEKNVEESMLNSLSGDDGQTIDPDLSIPEEDSLLDEGETTVEPSEK